MVKKEYTTTDTNPMGWEEFGEILNILIQKLDSYQEKHGMRFDIVAPILRNGGIPAVAIANKFKITRFLPVQVKYVYGTDDPARSELKQILSLPEILQDVSEKPNILVCETNTGSGESAKKSIYIMREAYPAANIYYATVAKVYGGPDAFENVRVYFWGVQTNEFFKASDEEAGRLGLRLNITIFPWETAEFELADINAGS